MSTWPETIKDARKVQERLSREVSLRVLNKEITTIAAFDASYNGKKIIGAVMVFTYPELKIIDRAFSVCDTTFPYVPGLLSFREGPALLKAYGSLRKRPDLLLFDGQGIAHPRGLGIASHMGVLLNKPSIGCAKSRLIGDYIEPPLCRGGISPLFYNGSKVGVALRTRSGVKPVFVSPGHLITFEDALSIIMNCTTYRIPEPLRLVDRWTKELKDEIFTSLKGD
jgi:deoxyribonuclease V